jgi:glycosyltransferase involved in cell wall biosynthesis
MHYQPFSVLMSVYNNEEPSYFEKALESCLNQTLLPDEIVLIKDGPLKKGLEDVIGKMCSRFPNKLKVIPLKDNVGLGEALRLGLKACSHGIIARVDSDDINMPDRFRIQLISYLSKITFKGESPRGRI